MKKDTKEVPILEPIMMAIPFFNDNILQEIRLIVKMVIIELDCVKRQTIIPVKKEERVFFVVLFKKFLIFPWFDSSIVFPSLVILYNNKQIKEIKINNIWMFIINYMLLKWFSC